jgi:uracil-DNA glycosylase
MLPEIPSSWREQLQDEAQKPYFKLLQQFVDDERRTHEIFPAENDTFRALELTPFDQVKVLLLGQDPYHGPGQAHGLCFSVKEGVRVPPSLRNIFIELRNDLGIAAPAYGNLTSWARQGVLMLNTILTVRRATPNSHQKRGWETFTDTIIKRVSARTYPIVFVLWGAPAQKKMNLIDKERHVIVTGAHPSPLSAGRGFFGSKPFSAINNALKAAGKAEIDWRIEERVGVSDS